MITLLKHELKGIAGAFLFLGTLLLIILFVCNLMLTASVLDTILAIPFIGGLLSFILILGWLILLIRYNYRGIGK